MSILQQAGPLGTVILGVGGLGVLVSLGLLGLGLTRRRVYMALWFLLPFLVSALGAIGTWMAAGDAVVHVAAAAPADRMASALGGMTGALGADQLARWVGAIVFTVVAWGAGLAAFIGTGPEKRWTVGSTILAVLLSLAGSGAVAGYWISTEVQGTAGFALAALLGIGGIGVAIGGLRRALDGDAYRVAALRFTSGVSLAFAVSFAGYAIQISGKVHLYDALLAGEPQVIETAIRQAHVYGLAGWMAFGFAFLIGLAGYLSEFGDVVQKTTLFDVVATVILAAAVFGVRMVENNRVDSLHQVAILGPVADVIARREPGWPGGADLPASLLYVGREPQWLDVVQPFFGDMIVFKKGEWYRTHAWNGHGWDEVDEPIAEVARLSSEFTVLIYIASGEDASHVVDLLDLVERSDADAALLLRTTDEITEFTTPESLPYKLTMLPIALTPGSPDVSEGKLWLLGQSSQQIYVGPVRYWGDEYDNKKEIGLRVDTALEAFEQETLPVALTERARVGDIVDSYLSIMFMRQDDDYLPTGKEVAMYLGDEQELIEAAEETFTAPEVEGMRLRARRDSGPIDADRAIQLLEWNQGAFAWCAGEFEEEEEHGRVQMIFEVAPSGRAGAKEEHRRNQVQSDAVWGCIADRLNTIKFPEYELPESEDEPEYAKMELTLTYQ